MSEKKVTKVDSAAAIDTTPIHPTIEAHLDSLSAGDLDRLADTYHPESLVILNKRLARITRTTNGSPEIDSPTGTAHP